jgi:hypothetical protein
MLHCHEFLTADRDSCKCRKNALQASKTNDRCEALTGDYTGEDYWNDQVGQNNKDNYDMCQKTSAIRMMFCDKWTPLDGDTEFTGLQDISAAYVDLHHDAANTNWAGYLKRVEENTKQHAAWQKLGVDSTNWCELTK